MTRWQRQRILATILLISAGGPLVSRVTAAWLDGPQEDKAPEAAIEEATAIKNVEVFFATSRLEPTFGADASNRRAGSPLG